MRDPNEPMSSDFTIEAFRIEPARHRICRNGTDISLEPMVMKVLCVLADHAGNVVLRGALIDPVWGIGYGADERLVRAISILRKAFREGGDTRELIETVPKSGYRLTRPVSAATDAITKTTDKTFADPFTVLRSVLGLWQWIAGFVAMTAVIGLGRSGLPNRSRVNLPRKIKPR